MTSLFNLSYKTDSEKVSKIRYKNIYGSALSFVINDIYQHTEKVTVVLTSNAQQANVLEQELNYLLGNENVFLFPDWETLPYDTFSPYQDIISKRLEILSKLETSIKKVLILNINTLMGRVSPKGFISSEAIMIRKGDIIELNSLRDKLVSSGYLATRQVLEHGEFSVRGSIVDLFPMGCKAPFRLDFFDNEIDTINIFDLETQRSIKKVDEINMLPAHEFATDDEAIDKFRRNYRAIFQPGDITKHNIYQQISKKVIPAGIEYYLPLFFDETATIFDYIPKNSVFVCVDGFKEKASEFYQEIQNRYERYRGNPDHPSLEPSKLYLSLDDILNKIATFDHFTCYLDNNEAPKNASNIGTEILPPMAINNAKDDPISEFCSFLDNYKGRVLITASSSGRVAVLQDLLRKKVQLPVADSISSFINGDQQIAITNSPLAVGFLYGKNLAIITEGELLGTSYSLTKRRGRSRTINPDAIIKNLAELKPGEIVVHEQYGIAEYKGLEILKIDGVKAEFVMLYFAGEAKMYIPITSLHLLSRYTGAENASLTKLGTEAWKKARNKAAEKIRDIAANLLDIYAHRAVKKGFKYKVNQDDYITFSTGFGYQPTEDQEKAFTAVLEDMQSERPMDRLICGDVGFGKTEVAMRAAYIAAANGKQVAILVPTTLLADQHYESFRDRFSKTPMEIACVSRFKTAKEQKQTLEKLAEGKIDIIIGTHKLLSNSLKFKDLGLLIVDEEHRFGVTQKEKIKKLRAEIDILTMTATPIPRTLNMAMNGIRDLSIIATPPAKRLAVRTFVHEYDDLIVREAVLRELKRGGQTYFLHNDVDTINRTADDLARIVPEAKIAVAHAQLPEKELAKIMHDFYHQRFNLLVCSTIIETGIDVPTANTIIMDRADKLGLAQMHQLRGRVGRSHHQAYAYLMTIPDGSLSSDARKRLQAIASLEELGSGFILATHDLEIRGAGEILGDEQSGQIEGIGFNLYMDMLDAAVAALKEGKDLTIENMSSKDISIELNMPVLLPSNYVYDVNTRLSLYKRLSSCINYEQIDELKAEIIDRFGKIPKETDNLIKQTKLRLLCKRLGIENISMNAKYGSIGFGEKVHVKFEYLTSLITQQSDTFRLEGASKLKLLKSSDKSDERLSIITSILENMDKNYEP